MSIAPRSFFTSALFLASDSLSTFFLGGAETAFLWLFCAGFWLLAAADLGLAFSGDLHKFALPGW